MRSFFPYLFTNFSKWVLIPWSRVVLCTRSLQHCTTPCVTQWVFRSEIQATRSRRVLWIATTKNPFTTKIHWECVHCNSCIQIHFHSFKSLLTTLGSEIQTSKLPNESELHHFGLLDHSEFLRTTEAIHINETGSVIPNLSCGKIVDRSHCLCESRFCSNLSSQCEQLLLKLRRRFRCDHDPNHCSNPSWNQEEHLTASLVSQMCDCSSTCGSRSRQCLQLFLRREKRQACWMWNAMKPLGAMPVRTTLTSKIQETLIRNILSGHATEDIFDQTKMIFCNTGIIKVLNRCETRKHLTGCIIVPCKWIDAKYLKERISTNPLSSCGIVIHIVANVIQELQVVTFSNRNERDTELTIWMFMWKEIHGQLEPAWTRINKILALNWHTHKGRKERDNWTHVEMKCQSQMETVTDKVTNTMNSQKLHARKKAREATMGNPEMTTVPTMSRCWFPSLASHRGIVAAASSLGPAKMLGWASVGHHVRAAASRRKAAKHATGQSAESQSDKIGVVQNTLGHNKIRPKKFITNVVKKSVPFGSQKIQRAARPELKSFSE